MPSYSQRAQYGTMTTPCIFRKGQRLYIEELVSLLKATRQSKKIPRIDQRRAMKERDGTSMMLNH